MENPQKRMEEVVKYQVLGSEINYKIRYLPERGIILAVNAPHFCPYIGNYRVLQDGQEEYNIEIKRAGAIYDLWKKIQEVEELGVEELEMGGKTVMNIELLQCSSEQLDEVIEHIENHIKLKESLEGLFGGFV